MTRNFEDRIHLGHGWSRSTAAPTVSRLASTTVEAPLRSRGDRRPRGSGTRDAGRADRPQERELLGAWRYSVNDTWLHTDTSLMPRRAAAWASWNYLIRTTRAPSDASLTYHLNRLQHLDEDREYLVTLNPENEPRPDTVIRRMTYTHPIFSRDSVATQGDLPRLNGTQPDPLLRRLLRQRIPRGRPGFCACGGRRPRGAVLMAGSALYVGRSDTAEWTVRSTVHLPGLVRPDRPRRVPHSDPALRFFSHNRFNLTGFDDRDHMGPAGAVRAKLERWLRRRVWRLDLRPRRAADPPQGPRPRLQSGVVFLLPGREHPAARGRRGQQHLRRNLLLPARAEARSSGTRRTRSFTSRRSSRSTAAIDSGSPPGSRMTAHIDVLRDGERVFDTTLTHNGDRWPGRSLSKTVARHPHIGLRTLALIHYQALRLWLKKAPFFTKPGPPSGAWRTRHG